MPTLLDRPVIEDATDAVQGVERIATIVDGPSAEVIARLQPDVFVFIQYGDNLNDAVPRSPLWSPEIRSFGIPSSQSYFGPRSELALLDSVQRGLT